MATRARIGIQLPDGRVRAAYQHWDGYPGGLGYTLCEHWCNPEKVLKAIELGNASHWGEWIGEKIDFDDTRNEQHAVQNVYYGRDRGEPDQAARTYVSEQEYLAEGWGSGEEYIYLMRDRGARNVLGEAQGEWFYAQRVWNTNEKAYDPAEGFQSLHRTAIEDRIRMLQHELKQQTVHGGSNI